MCRRCAKLQMRQHLKLVDWCVCRFKSKLILPSTFKEWSQSLSHSGISACLFKNDLTNDFASHIEAPVAFNRIILRFQCFRRVWWATPRLSLTHPTTASCWPSLTLWWATTVCRRTPRESSHSARWGGHESTRVWDDELMGGMKLLSGILAFIPLTPTPDRDDFSRALALSSSVVRVVKDPRCGAHHRRAVGESQSLEFSQVAGPVAQGARCSGITRWGNLNGLILMNLFRSNCLIWQNWN